MFMPPERAALTVRAPTAPAEMPFPTPIHFGGGQNIERPYFIEAQIRERDAQWQAKVDVLTQEKYKTELELENTIKRVVLRSASTGSQPLKDVFALSMHECILLGNTERIRLSAVRSVEAAVLKKLRGITGTPAAGDEVTK